MTEELALFFTEENKEALENLPEVVRAGFINRLANLQMKYMLADSAWDKSYAECKVELNALIKDIKAKLPQEKEDLTTKLANSLTDEKCFACSRGHCDVCQDYDRYENLSH